MPILTVHTFPDPILKKKAKPIDTFDEKLKKLSENMLETMYEADGIGLAANQVAILQRIVVVDIHSGDEDPTTRDPHVFVNPEITEKSGEVVSEEGCLSVIEFNADIKRAEKIVLEYQDIKGKHHSLEANELFAICIQHELDHLDGILFIDYLPLIKQKMVKKKLTKIAKNSA